MILVAVAGFGVNAYAGPTCKIEGTDKGTVEAYIISADGKTVEISFSNDSERYVNVRFTLLPSGCGGGSVLVPPQSSITKKVSSVCTNTSVDITGARCQ